MSKCIKQICAVERLLQQKKKIGEFKKSFLRSKRIEKITKKD